MKNLFSNRNKNKSTKILILNFSGWRKIFRQRFNEHELTFNKEKLPQFVVEKNTDWKEVWLWNNEKGHSWHEWLNQNNIVYQCFSPGYFDRFENIPRSVMFWKGNSLNWISEFSYRFEKVNKNWAAAESIENIQEFLETYRNRDISGWKTNKKFKYSGDKTESEVILFIGNEKTHSDIEEFYTDILSLDVVIKEKLQKYKIFYWSGSASGEAEKHLGRLTKRVEVIDTSFDFTSVVKFSDHVISNENPLVVDALLNNKPVSAAKHSSENIKKIINIWADRCTEEKGLAKLAHCLLSENVYFFDQESSMKIKLNKYINNLGEQISDSSKLSVSLAQAVVDVVSPPDSIEDIIQLAEKGLAGDQDLAYLAKDSFDKLEFEVALSYINKAIDLSGQSEYYRQKASILQKIGRFSKEIDFCYQNAIELASWKSKAGIAYIYFNYKWESAPVSEDLLSEIKKFIDNIPEYAKKFSSFGRIKILHAAILAECGQNFQAVKVRKEAKKYGGVDKNFYYLRYVAKKRGDKYALSLSELSVFEKLLDMRGSFKNLVLEAGGDVCIVGNSPSLLGSGRGPEIDSHKLVVRFNSYSTEYPYSQDCGYKTDIWVRMPFHPYVKNQPEAQHQLIMFSGSNRYYRSYTEWLGFFELIEQGFPVEFFDAKAFYELQTELGSPPTAGLVLCYMLYKIIGPLKAENYCGFSFSESTDPSNSYHYSDRNAAQGRRHDWGAESRIFAKLIAKDNKKEKAYCLNNSNKTLTSKNNREEKKTIDIFEENCQYDYVVTTSPGLKDYELFGVKPVYVSRVKCEKHQLYIESNGTEGELNSELDNLPSSSVIVGFGRSPTGIAASNTSKILGVDCSLVEYGLISSMNLPSEKQFNFSLVVDKDGIFYDTTKESWIEKILYESGDIFSSENVNRAKALCERIREHNITKYNNAPDIALPPRDPSIRRILVIDQTANDNSIILGQCEKYSFEDMLCHALDQENTEVYLKLHPETIAGAKGGNLNIIDKYSDRDGLHIVNGQCNIISLIKQVDEVYVMTSGVGLESIIMDKPVTCFGFPFYAGWGLTNDMVDAQNNRRPLTREALVAAVFIYYSKYYNPSTKRPCSMEEALDWIVLNKPCYEQVKYP